MRCREPGGPGPPGESRLGLLVFLVLLGVGGYLTTVVVPPYWGYWGMREVVRVAAVTATGPGGQEKAERDILAAARELDVPLTEEGVEIFGQDGRLTVRVAWVAPLQLPKFRRELRFAIERSAAVP